MGVSSEALADVRALVDASIARYSVQIHQVILSQTTLHPFVTHLFFDQGEVDRLNRYRVISTVFERDRVSETMVQRLNQMAQVWVACHQNVDMLASCGVDRERIRVVPVPYFDDDPPLRRIRVLLRLRHVSSHPPATIFNSN